MEDFENGIPGDFVLIDGDRLTPSQDMAKLGFAVGSPWIVVTPKGETNQVACSTSWYSPSGQSDDWMITPPLTILSEHAVMRWKAMAADKKHPDGYKVYMCVCTSETDGTAISHYNRTQPLFSVEEEASSWQLHEVSLADCAGQTIRLAFVNESTDKSRLYIDDILVAERTSLVLKNTMPKTTFRTGNIPVETIVYNPSTETVGPFTLGYTTGEQTFRQTVDAKLQPGEQLRVTLGQPLTITDRETIPYTLFVETSADDRFELITSLSAYQRKVVGEEVTGTWCQWCVRGIVMLDSLKRTANDWFIGMAIHSGDPMECSYMAALNELFSIGGLPNGVISRNKMADPKDFVNTGTLVLKNEPVFSSILFEAAFNEAGQIETTANLQFAESQADAQYKLAYAIIENNVYHPGNRQYNQSNAYGNNSAGPMGGWEQKPMVVPSDEMYYQEVVRGYSEAFTGIEGLVPSAIVAGEDILCHHTITLPDNIDDASEVEVIVMLVDATDNHIVNAEIANPNISQEPTSVSLHPSRSTYQTEAYSAIGQRVSPSATGLLIVRQADGKVRKVVK